MSVTASLNEQNDDSEYMLQRPTDRRIVIGSDHETEGGWDDSVGAIDAAKSAGLRGYLQSRFTGDAAAAAPEEADDAEWVGVQGYSSDELPWVGPLPHRPGVFIAAGYTGGGMPHCLLCGETVAEMMAGLSPRKFHRAFLPARDATLAESRL